MLLGPVLVSLFFLCGYLLPGVLGFPPIDFVQFALFALILPFSLPWALDNLHVHQARLHAEHHAHQEHMRLKAELHADLHDVVLNNLATIFLSTEVLGRCLHDDTKARQRLQVIRALATETSQHLRGFLQVLDERHATWADLGIQLQQWGETLTAPYGLVFDLTITSAVCDFSPPVLPLRACLYTIFHEILLNTIKHARATQLWGLLDCQGEALWCDFRDDGVGFDPTVTPAGHYGLQNMQRRVEALGGVWHLDSEVGKGTRITFTLPCR